MREAEPFRPRHGNTPGTPAKPAVRPVLAPSDYPESDGKPMAETPIHADAMEDANFALRVYFEQRSDVYVARNMMMYYREGDPRRSVAPDVWMAFGVPKRPERNTWLIWLEGKGPDFVLEITSKSTRREDEVRKMRLYEQLGVREYWQYDPTGDYLNPILKGRELGPDGAYRKLVLRERDGVLCHASLLGLELHLDGGRLRYFDPARNAYLLTSSEERSARLKAEEARQKAEEARLKAEEAGLKAQAERDRSVAALRLAEARIADLEARRSFGESE